MDLLGVAGQEHLDEVLKKELHPAAQCVVKDHLALINHLDDRIHYF
jgi:hypothetical protein